MITLSIIAPSILHLLIVEMNEVGFFSKATKMTLILVTLRMENENLLARQRQSPWIFQQCLMNHGLA